MSYTTNIKDEIIKIDITRPNKIALLSGFIRNNGTYENNTISLTTENKEIAELIIRFIKELYETKIDYKIVDNLNFNKKDLYYLELKENVSTILEDIGFMKNNEILDTPPEYLVGDNEEIRSYLKGVFLTCGSINNPKTSRYHMELLITKPRESIFVQKLLNLFDLNAKILNRDKGFMIYLKEAEKISDFIKLLGANKAVMYYENVRIYRDKMNQANRLNNCEQANTDKVVASAAKELENIKIIEENLGTNLLDDKTKEALEYRKKYPETSLKELSEIISLETQNKITKSGLYHRFRKINALAEKFKED